MKIKLRHATLLDAREIATRLRVSDAAEVMASSGSDPLAALLQSYAASDRDMRWTCVIDGRPEIMWGVARITADIGGIWLLGSDAIYRIKKTLMEQAASSIRVMHRRYPILTNFIDYRNVASLSWLHRLGFEPVDVDLTYGVERRTFIRYQSTARS